MSEKLEKMLADEQFQFVNVRSDLEGVLQKG